MKDMYTQRTVYSCFTLPPVTWACVRSYLVFEEGNLEVPVSTRRWCWRAIATFLLLVVDRSDVAAPPSLPAYCNDGSRCENPGTLWLVVPGGTTKAVRPIVIGQMLARLKVNLGGGAARRRHHQQHEHHQAQSYADVR